MKKQPLRKLLDRLYMERDAAHSHANALRSIEPEPQSEIAIGIQQYKVKQALANAQFANSLIDNVLDLFCDED